MYMAVERISAASSVLKAVFSLLEVNWICRLTPQMELNNPDRSKQLLST